MVDEVTPGHVRWAEYPEHIKLRAIQDKSQAIGSFLEWLTNEKKLVLASYEEANRWDGGRELFPAQVSTKQLLEEYFEIDGDKLEDEKLAMLDTLKEVNDARS